MDLKKNFLYVSQFYSWNLLCKSSSKAVCICIEAITYIIRFQLHSVAEDKSFEVGLLEDLIKRRLILNKTKHKNKTDFL